MKKLNVEKTFLRAQSHARKGETEKARELYHAILEVFPKNQRTRRALTELNNSHAPAVPLPDPPPDQINALVSLYKLGNFAAVAEGAAPLVGKFPRSFNLWNLYGATQSKLGRYDLAESAFKKMKKEG